MIGMGKMYYKYFISTFHFPTLILVEYVVFYCQCVEYIFLIDRMTFICLCLDGSVLNTVTNISWVTSHWTWQHRPTRLPKHRRIPTSHVSLQKHTRSGVESQPRRDHLWTPLQLDDLGGADPRHRIGCVSAG